MAILWHGELAMAAFIIVLSRALLVYSANDEDSQGSDVMERRFYGGYFSRMCQHLMPYGGSSASATIHNKNDIKINIRHVCAHWEETENGMKREEDKKEEPSSLEERRLRKLYPTRWKRSTGAKVTNENNIKVEGIREACIALGYNVKPDPTS